MIWRAREPSVKRYYAAPPREPGAACGAVVTRRSAAAWPSTRFASLALCPPTPGRRRDAPKAHGLSRHDDFGHYHRPPTAPVTSPGQATPSPVARRSLSKAPLGHHAPRPPASRRGRERMFERMASTSMPYRACDDDALGHAGRVAMRAPPRKRAPGARNTARRKCTA